MGIFDGVFDDGPVGPAIDVAGSAFGLPPGLGSLASGFLGFLGGESTNQANSAQSQAQMDFQERMSNTSYQRAVADMKAAGLNPMLAYSQGGASSPGGAQAVMQNSSAAGVNAAMATRQMDLTEAQTEKTRAETRQVEAYTPEEVAVKRQQVVGGISSARHTDELAHRARQANSEDAGSWEGRHAFERYARERNERQGEDYFRHGSPSGFETPRISLQRADARRALASAVIEELDQPRARAEAGYWSDVGKGGSYADHGTQIGGRLVNSAASVGLKLPQKFNRLTTIGERGSRSTFGRSGSW